MSISIALGPLADEPPVWLKTGIATDEASAIEAQINPRRKRELLWSRGLKASLVARVPELTAIGRSHDVRPSVRPFGVSIAHDRYFTAVALSQYGGIGVDLQTDYPLASCHQIAKTWFPGLESTEILASENCARFLQSWVIKESWAKLMNRSIFQACHSVGIWQGQVHIPGGAVEIPQFAWVRQYFGVAEPFANALTFADELRITASPEHARALQSHAPPVGFALGICLARKAPSAPNIECLIPGSNSELHHFAAKWEWLPVAAWPH